MLDEIYLCFQRGKYYYAIEDSMVFRILPAIKPYQLPIKETSIKGIVLVEENVTAIVDIENTDESTYYIILKVNNQYLGICADEIIGNKIIKDFEWIHQENTRFPFYYEEEGLKISHLNLELLRERI